jgi:hypothetical protein
MKTLACLRLHLNTDSTQPPCLIFVGDPASNTQTPPLLATASRLIYVLGLSKRCLFLLRDATGVSVGRDHVYANRLSLLQVALNSAGSSLTCDVPVSVLWLRESSISKFSCTAVFPPEPITTRPPSVLSAACKPAPAPHFDSYIEWSGNNFRRKRACADPR